MANMWQVVTTFWAEAKEVAERRALTEQPWLEEYLHWAVEDGEWVLHGRLMPHERRRLSTTGAGWCLRRSTRHAVRGVDLR